MNRDAHEELKAELVATLQKGGYTVDQALTQLYRFWVQGRETGIQYEKNYPRTGGRPGVPYPSAVKEPDHAVVPMLLTKDGQPEWFCEKCERPVGEVYDADNDWWEHR